MLTVLFFLILLDGATAVLKESLQNVTTAPSTFTLSNIKKIETSKFINKFKSRVQVLVICSKELSMLITLIGLKYRHPRDKTNGLPFHFYRSRTLH